MLCWIANFLPQYDHNTDNLTERMTLKSHTPNHTTKTLNTQSCVIQGLYMQHGFTQISDKFSKILLNCKGSFLNHLELIFNEESILLGLKVNDIIASIPKFSLYVDRLFVCVFIDVVNYIHWFCNDVSNFACVDVPFMNILYMDEYVMLFLNIFLDLGIDQLHAIKICFDKINILIENVIWQA